METGDTPVGKKQGNDRDDQAGSGVVPEVSTKDVVPAVLTIHETPYFRLNLGVGLLAVIALVAALYLARAFFVPLLIGILASYTLSPVVGWLKNST